MSFGISNSDKKRELVIFNYVMGEITSKMQ